MVAASAAARPAVVADIDIDVAASAPADSTGGHATLRYARVLADSSRTHFHGPGV